MTEADLTHAGLKARQRAIRAGFPEPFGLRVHRAISWIGRAEQCGADADARVIFLWIAFNAAYARDLDLVGERGRVLDFIARLERRDGQGRIYDAVWSRFPGPIRVLMGNRYVYQRFWDFQNGDAAAADWAESFARDNAGFRRCLETADTIGILTRLMDRLYVLRNQLVHGGATWNGAVNRDQVRDGAAILGCLVPVFVDIMMDHPEADWGTPFYPVVPD